MALDDPRARAALALARFGFGARPGDIDALKSDPQGALRAEIKAGRVAMPTGEDLPSSSEALQDLDEFKTQRRKEREKQASADPNQMPAANSMAAPGQPAKPSDVPRPQRVFRAELDARLRLALETQAGFAERLVWFWSNHFCVSVAKGQSVRVTAGAYEREAIRPHVFGRFSEMLLAVTKHPAMLIYLDNRQSIGPNSRAGERRGRGLNENLAREILELHTLGVHGGYTQADVTELARLITGWTVVGPSDEDHELGAFFFNANRHEPGEKTLLGKRYGTGDIREGEAALRAVADHPATAKHIALKLARHFVSDVPPKPLVERLAGVFRQSGGDLGKMSLALLDAPEAWSPERMKLRTPTQFIVAALRATGRKRDTGQVMNAANAMGEPLWTPSGPNGFPDTHDFWANPKGLKTRLDAAAVLGRQAPAGLDPLTLLNETIGPAVSPETRQAVSRAESRQQGIAIALMAPEFQRR
jgi:uncharacterized protein (DUF1800 family)